MRGIARVGRALVVSLAWVLGAVGAGSAQGGIVAGVVVSEATLRPLAGAQVVVVGTNRGVVTDARGRFRLEGLSGAEVTLRVSYPGYQAVQRTVAVGQTEVRIALPESVVALEELVVSGTPVQVQRRALGNAVSTVRAAEITEIAPITSMQQLLNGRAPGVVVLAATGQVGGGQRIRVRGASSFVLSNEPLIYVDGVRINNEPATGPVAQAFGSRPISRLNDLNPEEIERIEILKGPAATTIYGTEASGGVISIITKRGASGRPRWNLMVRQGVNYLANPEGRFPVNYQEVPNPQTGKVDTVAVNILERERQLGHRVFQNGPLTELDLSTSGGTDVVRYYLSGAYERSEGAEPSNWLRRYHGRVNVTVTPHPSLEIQAGIGYVDGEIHPAAEAGYGGRVWSIVLADPRKCNGPRRCYHSGLPEEYDLLYRFTQDVRRLTASVQIQQQLRSWLRHRLAYGTDLTWEDNIIFYPRVDSLVTNGSPFGNEALGYRELDRRRVTYWSLDYSASADARLGAELVATTSAGAQYYRDSRTSFFAWGSIFPAPGLNSISAATQRGQPVESFEEQASLGIYAQEQLAWRERLYLTVGLRSDDHSAFGRNFDRITYPKVSLSWLVSEEPFWRWAWFPTLRLRAAHGESGKQPTAYAAVRLYNPSVGTGDQPGLTPATLGNPDLGPERGKEWELGFDAGLLGDRLNIEFTWYDKRTVGAILTREIAPSVGYPGVQFFNAGEILNRGIELLARVRPVERPRWTWDWTVNLATNDNRVLDLGLGDLPWVSAGTFLRHQKGYPVGSWFEKRVVSARLDPVTKRAVDVLCDDGQGGAVPCAGADGRYGTADDAPAVYLGRTTPKLEGSVSTTIGFLERVRLYALVDFKTGYRKLDGNTRVRCSFFGGRCRENFYPEEFDPKRIAGIQSNNNIVDYLIDDASFAKLREVSLSYLVPTRWARWLRADRATVVLAGRNLKTWTRYGGLEPEAMFLGGSRGGSHSLWEQTTLPQLTQWTVTVNLGF